jgi:hypothetical protein
MHVVSRPSRLVFLVFGQDELSEGGKRIGPALK